ncbi:hypothetical protein ACQY0O_003623 [Thecaphora frezii]
MAGCDHLGIISAKMLRHFRTCTVIIVAQLLLVSTLLLLLPHLGFAAAESPGAAPNVWNTMLMANSKISILTCCEGGRRPMDNSGMRNCSLYSADIDPNESCSVVSGTTCLSPLQVVEIKWCAVGVNVNVDATLKEFEEDCKGHHGKVLAPQDDRCPFDNYNKPKPPELPPQSPDEPPRKADLGPIHAQPVTGSGHGVNTWTVAPPPPNTDPSKPSNGEKLGPKREGAYRFALVDNAITQALACCDSADFPHPNYVGYNCSVTGVVTTAMENQCNAIMAAYTGRGVGAEPGGARGVGGESALFPEKPEMPESTEFCSNAFANKTEQMGLGYCRLLFDSMAEKMTTAFESACKSFNGTSKKTTLGSCFWDVDTHAALH